MKENNTEVNKLKLGIFYFDPLDIRFLIPKKSKWIKYFVNLASPFSLITFQGIILFSVLIILVILI